MPILNLALTGAADADLAARAAARLTDLTETVLGKARPLIAVAVTFVPADHWFVGGRALSGSGQRSFFLDIRITDGSNLSRDKAAYLAAVEAAMAELIAPLSPISYVHVHDVRGSAYGYGGRSQDARAHAAT